MKMLQNLCFLILPLEFGVNVDTDQHEHRVFPCQNHHKSTYSGLSLDIMKMESWTHMGRTANIIIKDVIHIFASISKIMRILLMGRRNNERWYNIPGSPRLQIHVKHIYRFDPTKFVGQISHTNHLISL